MFQILKLDFQNLPSVAFLMISISELTLETLKDVLILPAFAQNMLLYMAHLHHLGGYILHFTSMHSPLSSKSKIKIAAEAKSQ